jgi:hypothetical protein
MLGTVTTTDVPLSVLAGGVALPLAPVDVSVLGTRLGVQRPLVLVALPVVVAIIGFVLLRQREDAVFDTRKRRLLFASRLVIVVLLVVAAAGPYTVETTRSVGEPEVTMLVDRSASMGTVENETRSLAATIEQNGVSVTTRVVGSGDRSRVGDGVVGSLRDNGSVLVVSDGQVTGGRSLGTAASIAQQVDATINAVNLSATASERAVRVGGPSKTSPGVQNAFVVDVTGIDVSGSATVTVSIDDREVETREVEGEAAFEVPHQFTETGSHTITATVESDDRFERNDVYRKTVRVVEPPRILYVSQGQYPFEGFLRQLYDVEYASSVPQDLSGYYAVVLQDMPAEEVGNVSALQRAVINGTGLVTVGGPNAFEHGNYSQSLLTDMLPVEVGQGGRTSRVVLAVDISGSTEGTLSAQQALALDALNQLGDQNQVGLVAFNNRAYAVSQLQTLETARRDLRANIRRLQSGGGTDLGAGMMGSAELLGESGGTVILLSDGFGNAGDAPQVASRLASRDIRVITIGVGGDINARYLQATADAGGGTFLRADETNRLRIFFGGQTRPYQGGGLSVVDSNHFITAGLQFRANPGLANSVTVEDRADYLVAGPRGSPAIAAWNYGLGRTVSITTFARDGTLDGLLARPDSLGLTRSVNWVIGDPERLETDIAEVPDTRVGRATTISYTGDSRPGAAGLQFAQVSEDEFEATFVPTEQGYGSVLNATYAVNYPAEYERFGLAPELESAVRQTGGQVFTPDQGADIARLVRQQMSTLETVTRDWTWLALLAALLVYLLEAGTRRITRIREGL